MARLVDADLLEEKGVQFTDTNVYIPIEAVWNAPTVEAAPVVHGRWEYRDGVYSCSVCCDEIDEDIFLGLYNNNFCPNCGAKMDEEGRTNGKA